MLGRMCRGALGAGLVACCAWFAASCAQGVADFGDGNGGTSTTTTGGGIPGGSGGGGGSAGSGGESACPIDCSTIDTDQCHQGACNEQSGQCQIVDVTNGTACDDETFCTVDDECVDGACLGGGANDCGLDADPCEEVLCNEGTQSCTTQPLANGSSCTPDSLCTVNATCTNGLCQGSPKDCTFAPVPDECHISQCNPNSGDCEPVPGNDGASCTDPNDLCQINGTCSGGNCQNAQPMSCSHLTQGCVLGICDSQTGQCTTQNLSNGDLCDDLDPCTDGETCQNGQCLGGTPVIQCIDGDGCCPAGCDENDDDDCSCGINIALSATATSSGGGSNGTGYGPSNWNDGVDEAACAAGGCNQCQGWISNNTTPSGAWMQYEWPSAVQIGSMYVDGNQCSGSVCYGGRTMNSGEIQYWSGGNWVTASSFSGNDGDYAVTFSPKLNTTRLRIYNVTAGSCYQDSSTLAYEWYVWAGSNCQP